MSAITDIIADTMSKVQAQPVDEPRAQLRRTREIDDPHPYDNTVGQEEYTFTPSQLEATGSYLDGQAEAAAEEANKAQLDPNGYTLDDLKGKGLAKDFASDAKPLETPKVDTKPLGESYVPGGFYTNFYMDHNPYKAPTPEELEKLKKKEKRDMLMAKIGAGLTAFNQAYSNARGIRPVIADNNIVGRTRDRYERLQKERDAKQAAWTEGYIKASNLDQAALKERRAAALQARQLDLREKEEERRQGLAELSIRKQDWLEKFQQGKLDLEKEKLEIERQYRQGQISKWEHDMFVNELRAKAYEWGVHNKPAGGSRGGQDKTVEKKEDIKRDAYGNVVSKSSSTSTSYGNQSNQNAASNVKKKKPYPLKK